MDKHSSVDLIVYPYQYSNESCSGAIRQGLASGTPVAVTPLSIFDDISPVVNYLPGISPEEISQGILNFFKKSKDQIHINDLEKWLDHHSFNRLANRLESILDSI